MESGGGSGRRGFGTCIKRVDSGSGRSIKSPAFSKIRFGDMPEIGLCFDAES